MAIPRPAAGQVISTNVWGIPVTDKVNALDTYVRQYATQAAMNADAAPNGCQALVLADYTRWIRRNGAWEPMWPRLVGATWTNATTSATNTPTDIPGASISIPYYAGHRYYLSAAVILNQTVSGGLCYLYLTDAANAQIMSAVVNAAVNEYNTVKIEALVSPTAAYTVKLRFNTTSGTVILYQAQTLHVFDYGP